MEKTMSEQTRAEIASQVNAFAFQTGNWTVCHRKRRRRLANDPVWLEFDGTCRALELIGGVANVDDHWMNDPAGAYGAATVRRLETDGRWSIWWMDSRRSGLDAPMSGRFEKGAGTFFGKDVFEGRPIEVRFIWSEITPSTCKWEQAFSLDDGASWETNWVMRFSRAD